MGIDKGSNRERNKMGDFKNITILDYGEIDVDALPSYYESFLCSFFDK